MERRTDPTGRERTRTIARMQAAAAVAAIDYASERGLPVEWAAPIARSIVSIDISQLADDFGAMRHDYGQPCTCYTCGDPDRYERIARAAQQPAVELALAAEHVRMTEGWNAMPK